MFNVELAWIFQEIADLQEFKGENIFKIRAYRKAARVISHLETPLREFSGEKQLTEIPGVGKNIAAKIVEILQTGDCRVHRDLLAEIPYGLLEVMSVRGIGPKKAKLLYESLNITSLDELEKAALEKKIRKLPGFGNKSEKDILMRIKSYKKNAGRYLLGDATELAESILDFLNSLPPVKAASLGGSLRRWKETVGDIDLLVATPDPQAVKDVITQYPAVREVVDTEDDRIEFTTAWRIPVDISFVDEENFAAKLLRNTGNRLHYERLQGLARRRGLVLENTGLYENEEKLGFDSEEDIYQRLGIPYIVPELRQDSGEIEAALAGELPVLLEPGDIKGDLHLHTNWSDGGNKLKEMALAAKDMGYQYIAITDHSQSLKIARGLSVDKIAKQLTAIEKLNGELEGIQILAGSEVDILADGSLDFPDEILGQLDLVIASVHSAFRQDMETMTNRVIAAIQNRHVDIIGHLTGRLLTEREPYAIDVEKIIEVAAKYGVVLEINSSPERLDLNVKHTRMAAESGVKIAINTDAHNLQRFADIRYGVAQARRAWLTKDDVLNTLNLQELKEYLRTHKRSK